MTTWQEVERHWGEFKPKFRAHWPRLKESEMRRIAGHRDILAKTLEADYEITHLEAEKEIDTFLRTLEPAKAGPG